MSKNKVSLLYHLQVARTISIVFWRYVRTQT